MKRRQFLQSAGLSTVAGVLPGAAQAQTPAPAASAPTVWRLVSDFPAVLDIPRSGIDTLASTLEAITDGMFRIEILSSAAGKGGARKANTPAANAMDALGEGKAQIGYTSTALYSERDPVFTIGAGLPFGPNARQFNAWLWHQRGLELLNDSYRTHGLMALPGGNTGALTGGWFKREVTSTADFAGMRISAPGLIAPLLERFGAQSQTVMPGEIAAALEQGQIDAAQWGAPHDDELLRLHNAAPFVFYPGWQGSSQLTFLIGLDAWNALSKPFQAALTAAAARAHDMVQAGYDALSPAAIKRLVAAGARLRPLPQPVLAELYKAADALAEELAMKNLAFRGLYDSLRTYRGDAYLWWQVAEYTYDNFMIRARAQG